LANTVVTREGPNILPCLIGQARGDEQVPCSRPAPRRQYRESRPCGEGYHCIPRSRVVSSPAVCLEGDDHRQTRKVLLFQGTRRDPKPWSRGIMTEKSSRCRRGLVLLGLALLVACSAAENAEQLLALTAQSRQAGRLGAAADLSHHAAGLKPEDFTVQYGTGLLYRQVTNLSEAEEHLRRATELRPESAPARLNLGVAILHLGGREAGRKELPEALRLDPRLTRAYEDLQDGTCDHASCALSACQK
jgi:hypothetical protein